MAILLLFCMCFNKLYKQLSNYNKLCQHIQIGAVK
jgi:hypothetical protein